MLSHDPLLLQGMNESGCEGTEVQALHWIHPKLEVLHSLRVQAASGLDGSYAKKMSQLCLIAILRLTGCHCCLDKGLSIFRCL